MYFNCVDGGEVAKKRTARGAIEKNWKKRLTKKEDYEEEVKHTHTVQWLRSFKCQQQQQQQLSEFPAELKVPSKLVKWRDVIKDAPPSNSCKRRRVKSMQTVAFSGGTRTLMIERNQRGKWRRLSEIFNSRDVLWKLESKHIQNFCTLPFKHRLLFAIVYAFLLFSILKCHFIRRTNVKFCTYPRPAFTRSKLPNSRNRYLPAHLFSSATEKCPP